MHLPYPSGKAKRVSPLMNLGARVGVKEEFF
jgi:hypothetical protein